MPPGHHHGPAGFRVGDHAGIEAEDLAQKLLGEHLLRRPRGDDLTGLHGDQVIRVSGRLVEVVQHRHQRGPASAVEVAHSSSSTI